ncbi:MAG: alpha/beta hydrolase [Pseudomonadota bacterium]
MSNLINAVRAGFAASIIAIPGAAQAQDASVVLVHGAFSDGSAWNKVIPILQEAGVSVSAPQLHLSSLENDAATVARAIDLQEGPVVLVGHSYGGSVITQAGAHEDVKHLVYVAGFALEAGQSLNDLIEGQPAAPWQAELYPDEHGYLRLTSTGMSEFFAPDLSDAETAVMAVTQGPLKYTTNAEAPSVASWSMKPTSYVIAGNDQIVPPEVQSYFAQKMEAETTTVAASHVAMQAQPEAVADVILKAVTSASSK